MWRLLRPRVHLYSPSPPDHQKDGAHSAYRYYRGPFASKRKRASPRRLSRSDPGREAMPRRASLRERDSLAVRSFAGMRARLGTWRPPSSLMTRRRSKLRPPESRVRPTSSVPCPRAGVRWCHGFTYIGLLIFIALIGIALAGTGMVWHTQVRRE